MAGLGNSPTTVRCVLQSLESFNKRVTCVRIKPVLVALPRIRPGQYLVARLLNGHDVPLSIANLPSLNDNVIELHIDHAKGRRATRAVLNQLNAERTIDVALPHGRVWVEHAPEAPLMLLASGTGFAQSRAILEGLLREGAAGKVRLLWRTHEQSGFYQIDQLDRWADAYEGFRFELICCEREAEEQFHRRVAEELGALGCRRLIVSGSKRFAESCDSWHGSGSNAPIEIESDMLRPSLDVDQNRLRVGAGQG